MFAKFYCKGKLFLLCYATTWFACIAKPSLSPVCCGEVCRVIVIKTASNINDPSTEKQLGTQVPYRPAAGIITISLCYQIIYRPIQKAILCDIYFLFNTEIKKIAAVEYVFSRHVYKICFLSCSRHLPIPFGSIIWRLLNELPSLRLFRRS